MVETREAIAARLLNAIETAEELAPTHPIRVASGTEHTCTAILFWLRVHRSDRSVVMAALGSIQRLTRMYGEGPAAFARRRLGGSGACQAIVEVGQAYASDLGVLKGCLECFKYLARENDNSRQLGAAGACEVAANAMRTFPTDNELQLWACGSIFNLASSNEENKTRLVSGSRKWA